MSAVCEAQGVSDITNGILVFYQSFRVVNFYLQYKLIGADADCVFEKS